MSVIGRTLHKALYHTLHPLLRLYRVILKPSLSGARAVVVRKGEVLLVRNIGVEHWSLPGGVMKRNEAPEDCIVRELKEELGVPIPVPLYTLGTYTFESPHHPFVMTVFVVELESFLWRKHWEIDEIIWFPLERLPEKLSPSTKKRLEEYTDGKRDLISSW